MARPNKKHADEAYERAAALIEEGHSYSQAAGATGIPRASIYDHCLRNGVEQPIEARTRGGVQASQEHTRNGHTVRRFTASEDALILQMEAENHGVCAIAKALGRRASSITNRLNTLARREARAEEEQGAWV